LVITRTVVERHGGTITLADTDALGTRSVVRLPHDRHHSAVTSAGG
jgi:signal transduction histidine kinase